MSATAIELPRTIPDPIKITQKIIGWNVRTVEDAEGNKETIKEAITLERPRVVEGRTYKISPAVTDSAMYITINDLVDEDGVHRPLEIFISSKHVPHQQWITALTRMVSAIFRKPGPFLFVATELQQIFDPEGGYFDNKKRIPSVVAHVGYILQEHFEYIGVLEKPELSADQKTIIDEKIIQAKKKGVSMSVCQVCNQESVISMDGCLTCTQCGDSKCV